jgi:hypothetical protein
MLLTMTIGVLRDVVKLIRRNKIHPNTKNNLAFSILHTKIYSNVNRLNDETKLIKFISYQGVEVILIIFFCSMLSV